MAVSMTAGTVLHGERVTLRPFELDELDEFFHRVRDMEGPYTPRGVDREVLRSRILQGGRYVNGELHLAIEAEGRLVGDIQVRHFALGGHPPGVGMIGISLFERAERGRGYGTEAVALLSAHMFEALDFDRVELSTDVDNVAMRRAAECAGLREEGVMRAFMPSSSGRRDYVMYGKTREDHEATRK